MYFFLRYRSIITSFLHTWYHDKTTSTPRHMFARTTFPRSAKYTRLVWKHAWNNTVRGRTWHVQIYMCVIQSQFNLRKSRVIPQLYKQQA